MPEFGEDILSPDDGDDHPDDCLFCKDGEPKLRNFKTKHGADKDEEELRKSLMSSEREVTSDPKVGPIHPVPGGNDPTTGWHVAAGILEEFEVEMAAAPHHIIPGDAVMAKSTLEKWTRASKGAIKQDIGYTIDGALNGIFLPHLPDIYWMRKKRVADLREARLKNPTAAPALTKPDQKITLRDFYGRKWSQLSDRSQQSIGEIVMLATWLQMHYVDHKASYPTATGSSASYNEEAMQSCNNLGDLMLNYQVVCERSKAGDGKHYPPYALVAKINAESTFFKGRFTGRPDRWDVWVSPLAYHVTQALKSGRMVLASKGGITRKY
ncbi:AHH domain-containing protein [Myxococcus sp. SDU36]|uniref:AHH domain-containing protein n=1 Tax=Myxococcus sp. SDU36 TaxID=2831967 RepID=UPI002543CB12|nr:AHH domain-containing protein [Myxococcus sp. SDU36]WIG94788.1 AHH domain-containing protein [Myxococcus sp. SDU36]